MECFDLREVKMIIKQNIKKILILCFNFQRTKTNFYDLLYTWL